MKYINEVLEFKLLKLDDFSLSVYNLILLGVIIFVTIGIVKGLKIVVKRKFQKDAIDEGRSNSILQIIKYFIYVLAFLTAIKSLGIDIDYIIAGFTALFVGLGFGLQDTFNDLIAGIIILFEGNVKVGDIVEVDGLVGNVQTIKLRTSLVKTRDGVYIIVPNSDLVNEKVINWTTNTRKSRFSIEVGVAYGSDVDKVREILLQCVEENPRIAKKPGPLVRFENFGDSSLDFELFFWTDETWEIDIIKSDLRFAIDRAFRANQISIPFPQRDIHIIQQ